jgi:single-strand DNA-binding protein
MLEQFEIKLQAFMGRLSKDPELRYMETGKVLCKFAIPLKLNKDDEAVWLNCESWNSNLSELIGEKYKKGDLVTVLGTVKEKEYQGKTSLILNLMSIS